jgi:uncharacterized repeat protein (TIGR03803 family)
MGVDSRHCWRRSWFLLGLLWLVVSSALAQSFTPLHDFSPAAGHPRAGVVAISGGRLAGTTFDGGLFGKGSIYVMTPDGSGGFTFDETYSFTGLADGVNPNSGLVLGTDGLLYGAASGGTAGNGVLFRLDGNAASFEVVHDFASSEGSGPQAPIQASDGLLYGTAVTGGDFGAGTLYAFDSLANLLTVIHSFSFNEGGYPYVDAVEGADGLLYGVTESGGSSFGGIVYKVEKSGAGFAVLHEFAGPDGSSPRAALLQGPDTFLYGTTTSGGASSQGTVFKVDAAGASFAVLHDLTISDGIIPLGALALGSDGLLYGTTANANFSDTGTVFRVSTDGTQFNVVHTFVNAEGKSPAAGLLLSADGSFLGTTQDGGAGNGTVFRLDPSTGAVTVAHSFVSRDAFSPVPGLVRGTDGYLYGITNNGGGSDVGAVFRMNQAGGAYAIVHSFSGPDGANPTAPLLAGADGSIYGTATFGGSGGFGTVFRIASGGAFSLLHDFSVADGNEPLGGLIIGSDGLLYGTTVNGGASGQGVVFRLGTSGQNFSVQHSFTDAGPQAGLLQGSDGLLYGTTYGGGTLGYGTVFRLEKSGAQFKVLHNFQHDDGASPAAALIQLSDGLLYGTTSAGTAAEAGVVFKVATSGHGFSVIHAFSGPDGLVPYAALLSASDGLLYGTTLLGGSVGSGTVFHLKPAGTEFGVSHDFSGPDGTFLFSTLVQGSDGALYGTARDGGSLGGGVAFRLDRAAYTLAVSKSGSGSGRVTSSPTGIDCGGACAGSFATGSVVTLTATPASTSLFAGWTGDADCTDGSVTVSSDKACTAAFNLGPNLVVFAVTGPASVSPGGSLTISDKTTNTGAAGAGPSTTRFYLSVDSTLDPSDVPLGQHAVPALAPGASYTGSVTIMIPPGQPPGHYSLLAVADANGAVAETNETDNVYAKTLVVH